MLCNRSRSTVIARLTLLSYLLAPIQVNSQGLERTERSTSQPATSRPADRIAPFQPGVRINWTQRVVETEATVIMRDGPIELFACSPGMREHEAIVRMDARPLHLFQALGLIGLTPGQPTWFDVKRQMSIPAIGDPVEIDVRYQDNKGEHVVPIEQWMLDARERKPVARQHWVFAGSMKLEDNVYAADIEGTVIALVDFSSALIALPELHSDSNDLLWLIPRTEAIPPLNTSCTLLYRCGTMRLRLLDEDGLQLSGRVMDRRRFLEQLRADHSLWSERQWVIESSGKEDVNRVEALVSLLKDSGIENIKTTLKQGLSETKPAPSSSPGKDGKRIP